GIDELVDNWQHGARAGHLPLQHTLRAIGYVDVLRVPTPLIERYVLSRTSPGELAGLAPAHAAFPPGPVDQDMLEFLVDGRYMNGTATMIIDLNRCTRCDE